MASIEINNAAPMVILLGTNDLSTRTPLVEPEKIPTHLPKTWLYAQKGPTGPQLVVGNSRNQMYGDSTFDETSKFANHQTILSNIVNAQGNAQMIERMIPIDAGPKSNFLLSIDILPTTVKVYDRDQDGKIILDSSGLPTETSPAATVAGHKIKWVVTHVTTKTIGQVDSDLFGDVATSVGTQTDGATTSMLYPIMQFWASSEGSLFNLSGLKFWAPNTNSGVNSSVLDALKVYPFRMSVVRKLTPDSTPRTVETEDGSAYFDFTFKQDQRNPYTEAQFYFGDLYLDKYSNTTDVRYPTKFADMHNVKIYQSNIEMVVGMIYAKEKLAAAAGTDFDTTRPDVEQKWLVNLFNARSSGGAQYHTLTVDTTSPDAVSLTESTTILAGGGSDGTMNDSLFNGMVADAVGEYANENSSLLDTAYNVESIVYDSGFSLNTKYAMTKVLAERKDMMAVLGTYDVNGPALDASEENSISVALRTRARNYPESEYFGTPATRVTIIGRNGKLRTSLYKRRLPLTLELAHKAARFMGASNGIWKPVYLFDKAPNNQINLFNDISIAYVPAKQRNKDWDAGLNTIARFDRRSFYFPALKTVYDDDTSVLTSFFTVMCGIELQKVGERVHRRFSGTVSLTGAQLCDRVNKTVEELTVGRFADLYKVVPAAYISAADEQRGFSWTLPIKLYANGSKTVETLFVEAWRMSDYVDPKTQ